MSSHTTIPPAVVPNPKIDRDIFPSLKTINISFANLNKSPAAFKELTLARARDAIIFSCETPCTDLIFPNLPGYYLLFADSPADSPPPRVCTYIANKIIDLMENFSCTRDRVTINLVGGWTVTAAYTDPESPIDPFLLRPINQKTIILGDFNAKHPSWFDCKRGDDHLSLSRGRTLYDWSRWAHAAERGPRLPTRHRDGESPLKLDLIWTRKDTDHFTISDYAPLTHSDHCILLTRCRIIKPPIAFSCPRPDYKRMSPESILQFFKSRAPPTNLTQLNDLLRDAISTIPRLTRNPKHKLPPDIRLARSRLRHLMKRRWGSDEYRKARQEYRESLTEFINHDIEDQLDGALDPEFFSFTKKTTMNRPIPTLQLNGQTYSGHARIAKCLANHHRAGPTIRIPPTRSHDIPPVLPREVTEALAAAPTSSAAGPNTVSASLLGILHRAHPTCMSNIYTVILRSGRHPSSWKKATVVPISKANKPSYTHPKSWRSIHLLSILSKTLERIVLRRLQESDTNTHPNPPMRPSQFGSRVGMGTSDAMQCYLQWSEHAHSLGHFTTLISADVEGGFDKVDPSRLSLTHLNPLYAHWIRHWAANRTLQFRPNYRLDPQTYYITNAGIPQGSPLSPFLFGAYIKSLMDPRQLTTSSSTRLVISYVDDVLICISADSRRSVESLARSTWALLNDDGNRIGMSFAENKTKTLHDRIETWGIGSTVSQLRFLGYWLETPPPDKRTHPPSFSRHLRHWTTKANYAFNMLRALTLRSDRGLCSSAILRILDACVRSILLYGIEFWGSYPDLVLKADAFIYGALRNLFDLPIATPHRALSSEFSSLPVHLRYLQITRRIAARRLLCDPLGWLDSSLPTGTFRTATRNSLDDTLRNSMLTWDCPQGLNISSGNFLDCLDVPGDVVCKEMFVEGDLIVFTDGSFCDLKLGFSFVIFQDADCIVPVFEYSALLTPRKTILDAEATALVCGLDAALTLPHKGKIFLISDCRAALRIFQIGLAPGPLNYLMAPMARLLETSRPVLAAWIKGHSGHPGNDRADALAKTASLPADPFPGSSHSYLSLHLTTATSAEWLAWFNRIPHHYRRPPRRSARHHRRLTRMESSVLFRLRSNKGWTPSDNIGTSPPPPCHCDPSVARDGTHLTECPATSRHRPPDISEWIHVDARRDSVLRWVAHHQYFNISLRTSQVRWISLSRPGDLSRDRHRTCHICTRTFTSQSHLTRHQNQIHPDSSSSLFVIGAQRDCMECHASFTSKTELDLHTARTHGCPDCGRTFTDIANMFRHMTNKHGGMMCAGCSWRFSSRLGLRVHQRSNCRGSRS